MISGSDRVCDAISKDKKREGDNIHFVLLTRIGQSSVEKIELAELAETLTDFARV